MAITRRQFVTRLGALAAAAGMSQGQIAKITEALADPYDDADMQAIWQNSTGKPTVVWVHGAECTGCSTSVLGLFEDVRGTAIEGTAINTAAALNAVAGGSLSDTGYTELLANHRRLDDAGLNVDGGALGAGAESVYVANIQDVLVDFIELDYHETVMNMGGDLAAQWLHDFMTNPPTYFVLVIEGAVADRTQGGAWDDASGNGVPWCSIGLSQDATFGPTNQLLTGFDNAFDHVVAELAHAATVVIPIGQCATFGGYPGCTPPLDSTTAGFNTDMAQSGAMGTYEFLSDVSPYSGDEAKVINVPGCPTNPWWFILTVVATLIDVETFVSGGTPSLVLDGTLTPDTTKLDSTQRLKITYPTTIHGPYCPRFNDWSIGRFAAKPGDPGCLQKIGCKGPAVKSLCGMHGWNAQQPHNDSAWEYGLSATNTTLSGAYRGGHCTAAGHPCMGCTEKGYPDAFVPFVSW